MTVYQTTRNQERMNDNQDTKHAARRSAPLSSGADLIAAERRRQIEAEGWTAEHDSQHTDGELADAAGSYAHWAALSIRFGEDSMRQRPPIAWPWETSWFKPTTPIRDLVKAGALIAAEIDRIRAKFDAEMADKHAAWEAQAEGS